MKRKELWANFLILFLFSFVVEGFCLLQNDIVENPIAPSENVSVFDEKETKPDFHDKLDNEIDLNIVDSHGSINVNEEQKIDHSVFAETASHNVGALNDVVGGTPIVVPLPEASTLELQAKLDKISAPPSFSQSESHENRTKELPSPPIEVHEESTINIEDTENVTKPPLNQTSDAPEDIPSFSEWAQKRLEEAEKNEEVMNQSVQHNAGSTPKAGSGVKLGWKNYASPDCGAKVVAANPEAVSPSSVLSPSREEYKLNVCTNRIWFIIELCEAIQAKKIDIANFELFSSTPKDFTVLIGDRFPSRDWTTVGQFTAKDERDVQSFDLDPYLFGRYIKVEIKSHHGSQHYCPISLFRVYGTSELEVLQKEELAHSDEDDDVEDESIITYSDDVAKNMLNSATNAVYSMIKKAAEVLGTKSNDTEKENNETMKKVEYSPLINTCSTPCHKIICSNCSDLIFGQVYELLSCKSHQIHGLTNVPYIQRSLMNSHICQEFGLSFDRINDSSLFNSSSRSVESFFSQRILGAMCNILAVSENKAVLNISQQFSNVTKSINESFEHIENIETSKINLKIEQSTDIFTAENIPESRPTDELKFDFTSNLDASRATCSTDSTYVSQIKPTKTVSKDVKFESSVVINDSDSGEFLSQVTKTETPLNDVVVDGEEKKTTMSSEMDEARKTTDGVEFATESTENLDTMENFDLNSENGQQTAPSVSSNYSPVDRQKESVFLRLSNRIKALERNVSLSSQYLEELSRRYKKQVEEMQKLMEKTLQAVTDERKKMDERNRQLEERLDNLMVMIGKWPSFLFWFFFTLAAACGVLWICNIEKQKSQTTPVNNIERRKSVDVIPTSEKKTKIRRPSDQVLKIVSSSFLAEERKLSREKRRRKRSNKGMKRSNSVNGLEIDGSRIPNGESQQYYPQERLTTERVENIVPEHHLNSEKNPGDWVEENHRLLEVIPLDESEHSSLEQFSTIVEHEVPPYTKTAIDSRAHRMSSQLFKPNINGENISPLSVSRKSESLDESFRFKKSFSRRSSLNSKLSDSSQKKERRSFKDMFKNVFS